MPRLIEILLENPILLILLLGWIFGLLGRMISRAQKAATQGPGRPRPQGRPTQVPPARQSAGPAASRSRPTEAEVAAEMRRILGMEPQPQPRPQPRPQPAAQPRALPQAGVPPVRPRLDVPPPERPPEMLRPFVVSDFERRVDPHVGERMQGWRAPGSGSVGAYELGLLGGRRVAAAGRAGKRASALVDLSDLPRAIVRREIFDRPTALREPGAFW